jgi:hypothetical protein
VPAGTMAQGVNYIYLIVVSGHKFLALYQTPLLVVLPTNYVDFSPEKTHPKMPSFTLHGFHIGEGFISRAKVLIFDDKATRPVALAYYVIATSLREINGLR